MVSELFLFCWTGSMVLDEAYYVNLTVYTIRWYEFTVQERKLLLFMMMRTQYPNGLGAFNYIMCNNETFFTVRLFEIDFDKNVIVFFPPYRSCPMFSQP